jgi:two-component system phosphate regulon sensor histidine kinase PhoR
MGNLVADLLLLSSLENQDPNSPSNKQVTDISALAVTICQDAQSLSQGQHTFLSEIQPHLTIWGEVAALRSAFSNLITNAVRYTPAGGIITVSCWQDQKQLYFAVSDTGIGIERKHIHRLTERFYRVDKGRSRDIGGTGLGLAIVKHVMLRHKARLKIESKFGMGSTFCCIFPLQSKP